jgi:hypothetical protein
MDAKTANAFTGYLKIGVFAFIRGFLSLFFLLFLLRVLRDSVVQSAALRILAPPPMSTAVDRSQAAIDAR